MLYHLTIVFSCWGWGSGQPKQQTLDLRKKVCNEIGQILLHYLVKANFSYKRPIRKAWLCCVDRFANTSSSGTPHLVVNPEHRSQNTSYVGYISATADGYAWLCPAGLTESIRSVEDSWTWPWTCLLRPRTGHPSPLCPQPWRAVAVLQPRGAQWMVERRKGRQWWQHVQILPPEELMERWLDDDRVHF